MKVFLITITATLAILVSHFANAPPLAYRAPIFQFGTLYWRAAYDPRQEVIKVAAAGGLDKKVLLAIWWVECRQATWCIRGKAGEYGPFQIMPLTGRRFCKGLQWKTNFRHNAKCAVRWLQRGKRRCKIGLPWQLGVWYNEGRCRWKRSSTYAIKLERAL